MLWGFAVARYFEAAAKRGNSMGHNGLGLVYMKSYGVEENYAEALKHFKKAAEQGHAEAQFHLGSMYLGAHPAFSLHHQ